MNVVQIIFQILYLIVHFLVSVLVSGYNTFCDVQHAAVLFYQKIFSRTDIDKDALHSLESKSVRAPSHPTIILLPQQFNGSNYHTDQLCSGLAYFAKGGSSYLSVYDSEGLVLEEKDGIKSKLEKLLPDSQVLLASDEIRNQHPNSDSGLRHRKSIASEEKSEREFVILNIQSYKTGMKPMLETVSRLGKLPVNVIQQQSIEDIHRVLLEQTYSKNVLELRKDSNTTTDSCRSLVASIPDPDMVIVVGEHLTSRGFPCWFLRLSEFVNIPSLFRLDSSLLQRLVMNFSKKEQRFGR